MAGPYDAFISYNHDADARLAAAVERGLERLAKPWYRLRALSVVRDMSDTGLTAGLWPTVRAQLDASRWLILMACPESAASAWVTQEVRHWCETKGVDTVLVVVTGGEITWDRAADAFDESTTALAPDVRRRFEHEPLHLDLRWTKELDEEPTLALTRFRSDMARLASPIRGLAPDQIDGEDVRLHRSARRLARAAVAALAVLAVAATVAALAAVSYARQADARAREAVARQLGLLALDMPASDLDRALLLSVASAELDPGAGVERFRPSRTLIGRHSRLTTMLHAPQRSGEVSLRAVAVSRDGRSIAATAWWREGEPAMLQWTLPAVRPPSETTLPGSAGPGIAYLGDDTVVVGARGEQLWLPLAPDTTDGGGRRVVALDTADGRAVVMEAGATLLVDVADGAVVTEWSGERAAALATGRGVVAGDDELRLFDASDGAPIASTPFDGSVTAVAIGPSGEVVSVTGDGQVQSWSPVDGMLVGTNDGAVAGAVGRPLQLAVADDLSHAVVVGEAGSALLDLTGRRVVTLDSGTGRLVASPSGRFVAVGGPRLTVWDLHAGQRVIAVAEKVGAMAWSACDRGPCRLVTAGEAIDVWEPAIGRRTRLAEQTNAQAVAITADGQTVVSAGWGAHVAVWSLAVPVDHSGRTALAPAGAPSAVDHATGIVARHDGDGTVTVGGADGAGGDGRTVVTGPATAVHLLDAATRLLVRHDRPEGATLRVVRVEDGAAIDLDPVCAGDLFATSPTGRRIVAYRVEDGRTVVCDTGDGKVIAGARMVGVAFPATAVALDDDGAVVLGGQGHVEFHRIEDGAFRQRGEAVDIRFGDEPVEVRSLTVNRGRVAAGVRPVATADGLARVLVWDALLGGTPVQFDSDHSDVVGVALLGDDADLLVTAGRTAFGEQPRGIDDDPDVDPGRQVVLEVWEVEGRRRLGRGLGGLAGEVIALGGDESAVVASDGAGRSFRWSLDRDPRREVCAVVGRSLTPAEWSAAGGGVLDRYRFDPVCDVSSRAGVSGGDVHDHLVRE